MAAPVVDLCTAIAAFITAQTYSFSFNVHRVNYVPQLDLAKTVSTDVWVYPAQPLGSATRIYDRDRFTRAYQISVHLTNYIDNPNATDEIDDALLLAHEIEQSLENEAFGEFEMVAFESETGGRPFFEVEGTIERSYFHVVININYEGVV